MEFTLLFKLNLIITTTGSLGAWVWEVQAHQTRQFTLNMLEFFILIGFNFYHQTRLKAVQVH
jgi:hypothetical protein